MSEPSRAKENETINILVVDDDPNELKSLVIGFGLENINAEGADTGSVALRMLGEKQYDVALIDLMMPDMNGLQLARVVRSVYSSVTTVLMSAYHLSPMQLARANAGVAGFVPKPFRFDVLVKFILSKVESSRNSAQKRAPNSIKESGIYCPIDIPEVMSERSAQTDRKEVGARPSNETGIDSPKP